MTRPEYTFTWVWGCPQITDLSLSRYKVIPWSFQSNHCGLIIRDINVEELTDTKFLLQPAAMLLAEKTSNACDNLAIMATKAPSRVPININLTQPESPIDVKDILQMLRLKQKYVCKKE
jgi:hypothetical protein